MDLPKKFMKDFFYRPKFAHENDGNNEDYISKRETVTH